MPVNHAPQSTNLLEVLEKILDKGVVIAGDIKISLADVDLLTIKIRLLIASVDKAKEIGMDWWAHDPHYSSRTRVLEEEHALLKEKINQLEQQLIEAKQLPSKVEEKPLLLDSETHLIERKTPPLALEEIESERLLKEKLKTDTVRNTEQDFHDKNVDKS